MVEQKQAKGGKKNRKYGRNAKRPAQVRYRNENRSVLNKDRNIDRDIAEKRRAARRAVIRKAKLLGVQSIQA